LRVEVRLFATLRKYLPPSGDGSSARLEMPAGSSVADVVNKLGIPNAMVHLVLVDGRHEPSKGRLLDDGAVLSIWPPIAGG
jgi:molybdopterin converting factor small subunit